MLLRRGEQVFAHARFSLKKAERSVQERHVKLDSASVTVETHLGLSDTPLSRRTLVVGVVIPCYQVAEQLACVVRQIGLEVSHIYCVVDACPAGSEAVAHHLATLDPRVRVIQHARNQGVGGAYVSGYRQALRDSVDVVVKIDGDGQMKPGEIGELIRPLINGEADYVKGNRFFNLADTRSMPWIRIFGNVGLSLLSKWSSGYWQLFDPTNGFTALHADVGRLVPWQKVSSGYFFESDLLFRLYTLRAVVQDVPMRARYGDEQSQLNVWKTLLLFPIHHARNFMKRVFYCYFLRDFNLASLKLVVGCTLIFFGVTYGLMHWIRGYELDVRASPGTVMLAALPIILGWQALLEFLAFDVHNIPTRPLQQLTHILKSSHKPYSPQ